MKRVELKELIRTVISEVYRPGFQGTNLMTLRGLNDVGVQVDYTANVYHGSGAADDPTNIELQSMNLVDDLKVANITEPTEEEQKVIKMYQLGARKLVPGMLDTLVLPRDIDFIKLNKILQNWLDEDIEKVRHHVYETEIK